ncbi:MULTISPECIES: strawberry notch-like NTP hydrolase domain-containing protein [Sphingomonas]|uniref:Methylase n=1 Tax=Sphingomonas zeae TaxID=1646122 RepID=A0A7Y6B2Z3_9SPHN|nr:MULTISPECIES: strawberry notch family protein [Sphingomonas]MBB4049310.1 putative RNA methylase [Sphingomonas zeae]MDK8188105.1 strawberry notch family protein [Sphingomonas zeae]MDK8218016.1 strawberry notch family protein [Sphingomonas sp. UMB7805-LC452B]NUU46435.1 methylase [Sphingomonas zeae]
MSATASAIAELDFSDPAITAAREIAAKIATNISIDRPALIGVMTRAYGSTPASGDWSIRDAYDVLELGQVLFLSGSTLPDAAPAQLALVAAMVARLPVHSVRSEKQIDLQQFSTPASIALIATRLAGIGERDVVLEPSAGTGLLAIFARRAQARLILNEIDPWRRTMLAAAYPDARIFGHDGEVIDDLLPVDLVPDVILINPPFSRSEGRGRDRVAGLRHLRSALTRLRQGGRCVAILPTRVDPQSSEWKIATAGSTLVRQIELPASAYARHGTTQAVQLLLLHKGVEGVPASAIACATVDEALDACSFHPVPNAATPSIRPGRVVSRPSALLAGARRGAIKPLVPRRIDVAVPAEPIAFEVLEAPAPVGEPSGLYLPYRPSRIDLAAARPHPTALVESIAMGSIAAPKTRYAPILPPRLLAENILSDAQVETVIYAGAAFERDLPGRFLTKDEGLTLTPDEAGSRVRTGFFLGDGTGAGKGRQVAAILLDQWLRGRRKHVWISKTETLLEDARRDWVAVGGLALDLQHLNQWKLGTAIGASEGVLFLTYATLRSSRGDKGTRLKQITDWLGDDYEGMIVFDEAHEMAGVAGGEGRFGTSKGSEQGIAGVRLQNLLPRARVLYVSATGASDVNNLAYATRLGLWGPGTAFSDRRDFVESLRRGGIAAMELIARDLKAQGLYAARALSFAGVEYDILEHQLTPDQIAIYDAYADAWGIIHRNLQAALDATRITDSFSKSTYNGGAKAAAISIFESTKQRFFAQLLISLKLPSLIPSIHADLARGDCVVIQLVSTAEAMLDRTLAALDAEARANLDIELSPREFLMDYLSAAFPTRQMRTLTDDSGNVRSEPMIDEDGRPIHSQEALRMREQLLEELCALPVVGSALDHIIGHFGVDQVAEVTGRSRRIVADARGGQRLESRSPRSNLAETDAFMRGAKRILIFSDAGGTGRSYHASLAAENQSRRIHYLLEPGWRADAAIQGLGRTHRTHQASAPLFRPVSTDCRGERRFISTIARRLDSLGALTRGQRQTGGQGLFNPRDNLESDFAKDSLVTWFRLLFAGKLASTSFTEFQAQTGLNLEGEGGGMVEDLPPIQRWLNRILALRISLQNAIFDEYLGLIEARIEAAREAGTLDVGVETIDAERITILDRTCIREDPVSGAVTEILRLETEQRYRPVTRDRVEWLLQDGESRCVVNRRSGKAAICSATHSLTDEDGQLVKRWELVRPARTERHRQDLFLETLWEDADAEEFAKLWDQEVEELRHRTRTETIYLVTGLLLPVWGKLPDDHVQVWRLKTEDGQSLLGRLIPAPMVSKISSAFGVAGGIEIAPTDIVRHVLDCGGVEPVGAYHLKRSLVAGEQRLELIDWPPSRLAELKALGCFSEIIAYRTRLFLPPTRAADILARIAA